MARQWLTILPVVLAVLAYVSNAVHAEIALPKESRYTLVLEPFAITGGGWVLGDPFFRDALLQGGQLVVAQDRCLPKSIQRIEIASRPRTPLVTSTSCAQRSAR